MISLTPLKNCLVVRDDDWITDEVQKSGLILPASAIEEPPQRGVVIKVGEGIDDLKEDDVILFSRYGPIAVKFLGERFVLMKHKDVWLKVEDGTSS